MEKLREAVIKLASAKQKAPLSPSQIALIDQSLHQFFPLGLHAPSHPLYSSMVESAITELNEADGSSEESIREYIKAKYNDLPWAHKSFLRHHLNRLCDEGLIMVVASDRYTIPGFTPKRVFSRRRVKGKQIVNRRVICPENSDKNPVLLQELKLFSHENECRNLVVVEDKEEKKDQDKPNSLINRPSAPMIVKFCLRKSKVKHDQLLAEEESVVDYSNGEEWMNNVASVENPVKRKKKDIVNPNIICAIGIKSPKPAESGLRVTRQQKKLAVSPVSKSQKHIKQTKRNWPSWVPLLLKTDFNGKCKTHANAEKNICSLYCSDCQNGALCTCCIINSHDGHHVIKVKQAGFEELVVDVSDIDKYIDIKDIPTSKESSTAGTTIVLRRLGRRKSAAKSNSLCVYCKSRVPFPNRFCSLSCKFEHEQLSTGVADSTRCKIKLGHLILNVYGSVK